MIFIKITRSDTGGSYTVPIDGFINAVDGELDGIEAGESITLTAVEMTKEEHDKLPEFEGW